MNKAELVTNIQKVSTVNVTKEQVNAVLAALEETVRNTVATDGKVTIPGICTVSSKVVAAREGIVMLGNHKGEKWAKPEHKEASVKIVKSLKNIFA